MDSNCVLKTVKIPNGETVGYREAGKGDKTLVLVHGNMSSSKHFDVLIDALCGDYKVYAIDLRGCGASSYNERFDSLHELSKDIKMWADEIGVKDFYMLGWSTGGGVAMEFAASYPDMLDGLICLDSVGTMGYPIFKKGPNFQPILTELLKTKEEIAADPIQVAPILNAYATNNRAYMKQVWCLTIYNHNKPSDEKFEEYIDDMFTQRNLVDIDYSLANFNISNRFNGVNQGSGRAANITCPTLVLQGEIDLVVPRQMAETIPADIKQAELVILKGCGHSALIDNLPELTHQIKNFCK